MSSLLYSKTFRGARKLVKRTLSAVYPLVKNLYKFPHVASIDETLDHIIRNRSSISRFGDSEFLYLLDRINLPYQEYNAELRERMREILISNAQNHLVGLPIGYHSLDNLIPDSKSFWRSQITWVYPRLRNYLDLSKTYFNASMTRVYVTFDDKTNCGEYFSKLMQIWEDREVLIVEGEKSRLGVGNDLFHRASSVRRIIGPMHHAFRKYNELYTIVSSQPKTTLILIAMGPTATVLAYDLARAGYQAIDIGNVDIEYEWFLRGATSKVRIPGKYTSEAVGGRVVEDINDHTYHEQIIAQIL